MTAFNSIERDNSSTLIHNAHVTGQSNSITQILTEPAYYHREYEHDVEHLKSKSTALQKAQRVAVMTLPFLALYKPLGTAITAGMSSVRTLSCLIQSKEALTEGNSKKTAIALFQTTLAVVAVAGTVFGNVYGMAITSGHDVLINLYEMSQHLQKGEHEQALEKFLQVITNSLYLTMILHGSLEIIVISLAAQILLEGFKSQGSFRKFAKTKDVLDLLEGFAHLSMAGIRGYQMQSQIKILQMNQELQSLISKQKTEKTIQSENSDENTKLGTTVQALSVQHTMYEGREVHIGYYYPTANPADNIMIITIINDPTGVLIPGSQHVFQNGNLIASSNNYIFEVVNGIQYVKHFYSDCYVYSTEQTQFVVSLDMQTKNLSFTVNSFLSELQKKNLAAKNREDDTLREKHRLLAAEARRLRARV